MLNDLKRKLLIINLLIFLIFFEISFSVITKYFNILTLTRYSTIFQKDFQEEDSFTEYNFSVDYKKQFLDLISDDLNLNKNYNHTIETAIELREQLLNISDRRGKYYLISRYPDNIYKHMRAGGSLYCGEIAKLYGYLLNALGFKVRYITVARSIFDSYDRHSTIEVWDNIKKKWIISDPTFNISFKKDSIFLSSDELYDLIHGGRFEEIRVIRGDKTKYEEQIDHYYISYYSLFDNIYYIKNIEPFRLTEFPPLRWFADKYKVYLVQTNEFPVRGSGIKIQNSIMFFILLLNPVLIIILTVVLISSEFRLKSHLRFRSIYRIELIPIFLKIAQRFQK